MTSEAIEKRTSKIQNLSERGRSRLVRQYFFVFVLLLGGGLFTSGLLELYFRYRESHEQIAVVQGEIASAAALRIAQFILTIEEQLKAASVSSIVAYKGVGPEYQFELAKLLAIASPITEVVAINADGQAQAYTSRFRVTLNPQEQDFSRAVSFLQAKQGVTFFGAVNFNHETEPYMIIAVPIERFAGSVIGVLQAQVNLRQIWEVVREIKFSNSGYAYIVTRSGDLIAHSDPGLVLQRLGAAQLPQVQAAFQPTPVVPKPKTIVAHDLDGQNVLSSFAFLPSLDWSVFVEQPLTEAYESLYGSILRTSALLLVGLGMALLASVYMARRVVRPLHILRRGVERISRGDLDFHLQITTGDEIESLADEFNKMAQQQKAMTQLSRALTSELTLNAVCHEFADGIRVYIPYDRVLISRIDADENLDTLFLLSPAGETPERMREMYARVKGRTATDWLIRERRAFIREDTLVQREFDSDERLSRIGIRSYVLVPLFYRDRLVGRLHLGSKEPKIYHERHAGFLLAASEWLAMAIENARLYEQEKRHAHELESKVSERTQELVTANEKLKELDKMKSDFVSNVSHELRTPLTAIQGLADNMFDGITGELNDNQISYMKDIKASTDRLARLIEDLLDLSIIEAGRTELRWGTFSLAVLVDEVAGSLRPMAKEKRLQLEIMSSDNGLTAWGDQDKITQVLTNLISNALKFTPSQGEVNVGFQKHGDAWIQVSVSDTGSGIPAEEQEKIFDEFYQITEPGKRKSRGVGLGLAISKKLIEMHGGTIWVESNKGKGSTFYFTVPGQPLTIEAPAHSQTENERQSHYHQQ